MKKKIIRVTTVPASLMSLLKGQLKFVSDHFEVIAVSSKGMKNQLNQLTENEGVRTVKRNTRKITPAKDIIALWKIYRLFKNIFSHL